VAIIYSDAKRIGAAASSVALTSEKGTLEAVSHKSAKEYSTKSSGDDDALNGDMSSVPASSLDIQHSGSSGDVSVKTFTPSGDAVLRQFKETGLLARSINFRSSGAKNLWYASLKTHDGTWTTFDKTVKFNTVWFTMIRQDVSQDLYSPSSAIPVGVLMAPQHADKSPTDLWKYAGFGTMHPEDRQTSEMTATDKTYEEHGESYRAFATDMDALLTTQGTDKCASLKEDTWSMWNEVRTAGFPSDSFAGVVFLPRDAALTGKKVTSYGSITRIQKRRVCCALAVHDKDHKQVWPVYQYEPTPFVAAAAACATTQRSKLTKIEDWDCAALHSSGAQPCKIPRSYISKK